MTSSNNQPELLSHALDGAKIQQTLSAEGQPVSHLGHGISLQEMNKGWIKTHRKLADHPRYRDSAWVHVWVHLLLHATHQEFRMVFGSKVVLLKPGQLITSRKNISAKTGINESKVERILKQLESEQQIEQVSSSISRLLTVLNWADYQESEQLNEQQSNNSRTTPEQQSNTNKNIKNIKNIRKEKRVAAPLDDEWLKGLQLEEAYEAISVSLEFSKCKNWCSTRNVQPSRRRFINWLNNARPITSRPKQESNQLEEQIEVPNIKL